METFEEGFAAVETAAGTAAEAAAALAKAAKQLLKAAQDGNVGQVRRQSGRLTGLLSSVSEHVERSAASWPFTVESEYAYLEQGSAPSCAAKRTGSDSTSRPVTRRWSARRRSSGSTLPTAP